MGQSDPASEQRPPAVRYNFPMAQDTSDNFDWTISEEFPEEKAGLVNRHVKR